MSTAVFAPNEIGCTRVLNASRELVWQAWTDPKRIGQWWGPRGFTTTTSQFDFRPGGTWRFVMHGPDGVDYPNIVTYREIVEPERLVYAHSGEEHTDDVHFVATVLFEDEGDKTRLTMCAVFKTVEQRDRVADEFGAVEGMQQTLERLSEHLAQG